MANTFADYWSQLTQTNPGRQNIDSRMTVSVGAFKRQLEKAYQQGATNVETTTAKVNSLVDALNKAVGKKG